MKRKWRDQRYLEQVHEIVQPPFETLQTMIRGVEKVVQDHIAQTSSMIVDLGKRQDEELLKLQNEIAWLKRQLVEIRREHQTFIQSSTDRFNRLYKDVESKVNDFYKCIDLVKGKRDLDYMTVDEYLLLLEPGRRGPICDEDRKGHEARLDVLMRENGMQPGMVRAPFDKIHRTYPRDVIIDHFNDHDRRPRPCSEMSS